MNAKSPLAREILNSETMNN